jgi:hypothetical protein
MDIVYTYVHTSLLERYPKGGFVLQFETSVAPAVWSEAVFDLLAAAQRLGRAWQLYGDIHMGVDAHTNEADVQGVRFIHLACQRTSIEASSST